MQWFSAGPCARRLSLQGCESVDDIGCEIIARNCKNIGMMFDFFFSLSLSVSVCLSVCATLFAYANFCINGAAITIYMGFVMHV